MSAFKNSLLSCSTKKIKHLRYCSLNEVMNIQIIENKSDSYTSGCCSLVRSLLRVFRRCGCIASQCHRETRERSFSSRWKSIQKRVELLINDRKHVQLGVVGFSCVEMNFPEGWQFLGVGRVVLTKIIDQKKERIIFSVLEFADGCVGLGLLKVEICSLKFSII